MNLAKLIHTVSLVSIYDRKSLAYFLSFDFSFSFFLNSLRKIITEIKFASNKFNF